MIPPSIPSRPSAIEDGRELTLSGYLAVSRDDMKGHIKSL
jgi:hypothetical protein